MSEPDSDKLAIERAAGNASARFLWAVPIVERSQGQIVWKGMVEVFEVTLHDINSIIRGYVWMVDDPAGPQFVTVLGKHPIKTPLDAVRSWLASLAKK